MVQREADDTNSVKDLLRKTLGCLRHEKVVVELIGAQVYDVDQKFVFAITDTLQYQYRALTLSVHRRLHDSSANAALRSFDFPKVHSTDLEEMMRKIVGQSMYKFLYSTVPILAMTVVTGVLAGPLALIPMAVNSLLSTPATARVVVSCSCDIILCLERAFSVSSEWRRPNGDQGGG